MEDKKLKELVIVFVCSFLLFLSSQVMAQNSVSQKTGDSLSLDSLAKSGLHYSLGENNRVTFINGQEKSIPLSFKISTSDAITIANQFTKEYGKYFGIKDADNELFFLQKKTDELGMQHIRFNQKYQGVPVFGSQIIVHLKKDLTVSAANGEIVPDISLIVNPKIDQKQAFNKAKEYWQKQFRQLPTQLLAPRLYVFNKGLLKNKPDNANYLVWEVELYNQRPAQHEFYYINTQNGELVYQITGMRDAIDRRIYDCTLGGTIVDYWLDYSFLGHIYGRSEGKPVRGTNPIYGGTDVDTLYTMTSNIHDYFFATFGRNGANNQGGLGDGIADHSPLAKTDGWTYIDYVGESCPNAYFDGFSINFCKGLVYTDVAAHEYTHGVDQFSILDSYGYPSGLIYAYESGALNEAFSDIFGEAVENYAEGPSDWLLGEDINVGGLIGPLRSMSNPSSLSDSIGPYPDKFYNTNYYCGSDDSGGVHHNSSVVNYAAYLMAEGGTFNGCSITGIGKAKEEQIFYRALTQYLTPSSGFNNAYNALITSCNDLYGAGSADCLEVTKALQVVEMDQAGLCSDQAAVAPACAGPATITNVTSAKTNGYYKAGAVIDVVLTFSHAVTSSGGNVTVTFDTGGTCGFTVANSATGTCNYTVAAGENSADLNVTSIAGTISDSYGYLMTSFTPATNLSTNKNIIIDTTLPTGTITINSGAVATNSGAVTLTLSASDTNGISYTNFYADGSWSGWETYSTSRSWTLDTASQGSKTVYVQFSDAAGNIMDASAYDDIIYDSIAPTTSASPAHGKIVKNKTVTLTADETATIYYTTNGAIPNTSSLVYNAPIIISQDTTIYYFAVDQAGNIEDYKATTFIIIKPSSIITAAGPGGGPHIRVFNYSGTALASPKSFFAFNSSYRGGVHVAACDVNNDGFDEIIVGVGTGEEPWVKVFKKNGSLVTQFLAYAKNIKGGVFVACGDLNGDLKGEIVTGVPEGFGPHVRVFNGETGKPKITNGFFAYAKNVRTGIRVAVGDLDGDGKDEIIVGTGTGAGTHVRTFSSTGVAKFTPGFFVYDKSDRTGIKVAAGDVNGDGKDEIITGSGNGRIAEVKVYTAYGKELSHFRPYGNTFNKGIKIASGDIDADGISEIITGTEIGSGPQVRSFDINGKVISSFFAYDKNFRGGVEPAVGLFD